MKGQEVWLYGQAYGALCAEIIRGCERFLPATESSTVSIPPIDFARGQTSGISDLLEDSL